MQDPSVMPSRLEAFLAEADVAGSGHRVSAYEPIQGGYSRLMARFRLECERDGSSRVEELVLRGDPPAGSHMIDTDRDAEWALLEALARTNVPMPAPRFYDRTGRHLGTKAFVVDLAPGESLLRAANRPDADRRALSERFCDTAAAFHSVDVAALPLERPADWDAYLGSVIGSWSAAERAHLESDPFMRYMGAWLSAHRPPPAPFALVHGDFQLANVLVAPSGEFSVVDWEFAHVGDPREDLGWSKAVATVAPPDLVGEDEAAFCARYRERTGLGPEVVNPLTLAYFSVLAAARIYSTLLVQLAAFAEGRNDSLLVAYNVGAGYFAHGVWMAASAGLEAAMAAVEAGA